MPPPKFIKGGPYTKGEIMGILGPENPKNRKYLHDIQPVPNYNGEVIIPTHSNSEGSYTNSQSRINSEGSFNNTISNRENSNIVSNNSTPSNSPNKPKTKNKGKGSRKSKKNKSRRKGNRKSKKDKSRKEANKKRNAEIRSQRNAKATRNKKFNSPN